jgi:putative nucleotidyltransferase with HDIG domain
MIDRDQALEIVREYVKNENLVRHMLAVEACMAFYARKFNEDENFWRVAALLHDFDWEIHPDLDRHPQAGAPILRERGVPEEVIQVVLSHADHTGVPRDSRVRKALAACDEITGLVTACTLVRPSRSIHDLTVKSVKKKWNNKQFAAGANREEIEAACADFGIDVWEHVGNVISAMQGIAGELGLAGDL